MVTAGMVDPRYTDPRPSMSQLAQHVGVHTSTITSMIWGERETDLPTIERTAQVLNVDVAQVAAWAGRALAIDAAYEPPAAASLLDAEQRKLVDSLIRQLTRHHAAAASPDVVRREVEDVEGATRLRPQSRRQLERELDVARRRLADAIEAAGDDPLLQPAVDVHRGEVQRLERAINGEGGQGRATGS